MKDEIERVLKEEEIITKKNQKGFKTHQKTDQMPQKNRRKLFYRKTQISSEQLILKFLMITITNLIQISQSADEHKAHFSLEVKKNDYRDFEISALTRDKTIKFSGDLVEILKYTKSYVAIMDNELMSVHTAVVPEVIDQCTFWEVGSYQGLFMHYKEFGGNGQPNNMLLCLKKVISNPKKTKKISEKHNEKKQEFESEMMLVHLDKIFLPRLEITQKIKCRFSYLDAELIKDFVFTYKGGRVNKTTEIGVFIENPVNYGSTRLTVHYLSYNSSGCSLKQKVLNFGGSYIGEKDKYNYRVINDTIFFFKMSRVPMALKQKRLDPILVHFFPATAENPRNIKAGMINLDQRPLIEEKSSVEIAELTPDQAYFILMGQSEKVRITVSKFEINKQGEGVLGSERLMKLPKKMAETSDANHPLFYILHFTSNKDLLIFTQDPIHEKLVINFCKFYQKTLPELSCSSKTTKFDIIAKFGSLKFFMRESGHIGNLVSFDFYDQKQEYSYSANLFNFYKNQNDSKSVENLKLVSTFINIDKNTRKKRSLVVFDYREKKPNIQTIVSDASGFDKTYKDLRKLEEGRWGSPVLNYHHKIFKHLKERTDKTLKLNLMILPSSTQDLLHNRFPISGLKRKEIISVTLKLIDSSLSEVDFADPTKPQYTYKDSYVGDVVRIATQMEEKLRGSLIGCSIETPRTNRKKEPPKLPSFVEGEGRLRKNENGSEGELFKKQGGGEFLRDGKYLNFNMLKSNNVEFFYPKSVRNSVVDDIFYTGTFILGVASKFSVFPLVCEEHLIQDENDYKKYDVTPNRVKVINKYRDQTFYEFTFLESCKPLAAYIKIDFEKIIIEEVKTSENIIALKCRNISSFEHLFIYMAINNQKEFDEHFIKVPILPPFTKFEIIEIHLSITQLDKDENGRLKGLTTRTIITSVTIFSKDSNQQKKKTTVSSTPSSGHQETESEIGFDLKLVFLKSTTPNDVQAEKEFPAVRDIKVKYGIEFAKEVKCLKTTVKVGWRNWVSPEGKSAFGFGLLMIFGCEKTDIRGVFTNLNVGKFKNIYLEFNRPFSTRVDLAYGFDLKLPVKTCMTNSKMMLFYQEKAGEGVKVTGKDLNPGSIRNDYDFDLDLFPFTRIFRLVCVSELDFGVIIGEVDLIGNKNYGPKKEKKGLGILTVKLKGMEDYHDRLFDYYTLGFIPKNVEQDVRIYPVTINRRPKLIILVKYLRRFYTRKILLDGPDLFVTPRTESIFGDKNETQDATQSAKFFIKYFLNNTKDYQSWYLRLDLKTGYDRLKIKSEGYSMVINNTKTPEVVNQSPEISKGSSGGSGSPGPSSSSNGEESKSSLENKQVKKSSKDDHSGKKSNQIQNKSRLVPTPFYLLKWRTIYQDKPLKFDPKKAYILKTLAWIQGHVIKLSVQHNKVTSQIIVPQKENKNGEKNLNENSQPKENSKRSKEQQVTGLLTRASVDEEETEKIKPYFKHERIDYLTPSSSKGQKMRLILGNEDISPYCLSVKRRQDPTASAQYVTAFCFKPPEIELVWYSPENLNQSLILSTDSSDYQFTDAFDFFVTKDRMVFTLIRKARIGRYSHHTSPSSDPEFQHPMFIFAQIMNTDSQNIINKLHENPKFYVMKDTFKNKKGVPMFAWFEVTSKQIKGELVAMKTWDAPRQTKRREQVIFMLTFVKDISEGLLKYTLRRFKISTRQSSRKGSPKEPAYWYGFHCRKYYNFFGTLKGYFFMKVNSLKFRDPSQISRFNHGDPLYIFYFVSTKKVLGEHLKMITSTYRTHGKDLGALNVPRPMKEIKPDIIETFHILTPNDCIEASRMVVSCIHANNEHSMIENLFYKVKIHEHSKRVYLEMFYINKYLKHHRKKYIKIKQGFKYFGVLIHPSNHEQAGIYVYKKIEHGGTQYVYYFLGLADFAEVKDYNKVSYYFESGPLVKDPYSTLTDCNETLVVFSSKKNLFMRYNLTEFEVAFKEEAKYKDLEKFKMVVENFQSEGSANFTSFFEKEEEPNSNRTKNGPGGNFWERYEDWIEGLIYVAVVILSILLCVYWVKRKQRLERERISRDEDMIYDLDDFRF